MSVSIKSVIFRADNSDLDVKQVKAFGLQGIGALSGVLWVVQSSHGDWYLGKNPGLMREVYASNMYGADTMTDVTVFVSVSASDQDPVIMMVGLNTCESTDSGPAANGAPYLSLFLLDGEEDLGGPLWANWNFPMYRVFDGTSNIDLDFGFNPSSSTPHNTLTHIGPYGPSRPNSLFVFGVGAGAFEVLMRDILDENWRVWEASIPCWEPSEYPWVDPGSYPTPVFKRPWRVSCPSGYFSRDYTFYAGTPVGFLTMGITTWTGLTQCRQLVMFAWSRLNQRNVTPRLTSMYLVSESGELEVRLHNHGPHEHFMSLEYGVGGGNCFQYMLPTGMQNYQNYNSGNYVLAWDALRQAATITDPGSVVEGDGSLYGSPSFIRYLPNVIWVMQEEVNQQNLVPSGTKVMSLDAGYIGLLMDASTGKGNTTHHLTNAGVVVASNKGLHFANQPSELNWNAPNWAAVDVIDSLDGRQGALVSFRPFNIYGGHLSNGWWAMYYHRNSAGGVTLSILHSTDGQSWTPHYSQDIVAVAVSQLSGYEYYNSNFNVRKYSTTTMMYFRAEFAVVPVGGGVIKDVAVTVMNTEAQGTNGFTVAFEDTPSPQLCTMPSVMLGDSFSDVYLVGGDRAIYKISSDDGARTTAMPADPVYSQSELNKSISTQRTAPNQGVGIACLTHLPVDGSTQLVGFYGYTEGPVGFLVTMGTPTLIPVVDYVTQWRPDVADTSNYPSYKHRYTAAHPDFGSIIFVSDSFGTDELLYLGGRVCGASHVLFSDPMIRLGFQNTLGPSWDAGPNSFQPLGFQAQCVYEHYELPPGGGAKPTFYVTDHDGYIRKMQISTTPFYGYVFSDIRGHLIEVLATFDDAYDQSAGYSVKSNTGMPPPLKLYNASYEEETSSPITLASKFGGSGSAVYMDGAHLLMWAGMTGNFFQGAGSVHIFDLCASVEAIPDGSWGCLFSVKANTVSPSIDMLINHDTIVLRWYGPHADQGTTTHDNIYIYKTLVDSEVHHYRVIFAEEQVLVVIDGVVVGQANHGVSSWFKDVPAVEDTVSLMGDPNGWGYFCTGAIEWFRVLNATCASSVTDLATDNFTLSNPVGKPNWEGDYSPQYSVSFPIQNTTLANSGKFHLSLTYSNSLWVATWCEDGDKYCGSGPMVMATSPDMSNWTVVEGTDVVVQPASPIMSMTGIKPQPVFPVNFPEGVRGFLNNYNGTF